MQYLLKCTVCDHAGLISVYSHVPGNLERLLKSQFCCLCDISDKISPLISMSVIDTVALDKEIDSIRPKYTKFIGNI